MPQDPNHDHEELEEALSRQLDRHVQAGAEQLDAGDADAALASFQAGLELLPEPKHKWVASTWLHASVANIHFDAGRWQEARDNFAAASDAPSGLSNAFIQLRLGQAEYELGNIPEAAHHLLYAHMRGPQGLFEDQDPKYHDLVLRAQAELDQLQASQD